MRTGNAAKRRLKRFQMLERKHRGRREHGNLLAVRQRLERGAHGDFRLAVADVAAEQPVHRQSRFHVALHIFDGALLVRGFLEFESVLEFALPVGIRRKRVAGRGLALGVKREELLRHVVDGLAHARLARFPDGRAQAIERGLHAAERLIFLHQVDARERHVELRVSGVAQEHEFAGRAFDDHLPQAFELADAVVHVNDIVARLQVREIAEETRRLRPRARALRRQRLEKIGVAVDGELRFGKHDAFAQRRLDEHHGWCVAAARFLCQARDGHVFLELAQAVGNFVLVADIGETFEFARARGGHHHVLARGQPAPDFGHERGDVSVVARGGLRFDRERRGAILRQTQMLDGQSREKLQRERPFVFVENVTVGRLGERIFDFVESLREARAIFLHGGVEQRRLVQHHDRVGREIEQHARALLPRHLAKFPAGVKTRGSSHRLRGRTRSRRAAARAPRRGAAAR